MTTTTSPQAEAMAPILRGLPPHAGPPRCQIVCGADPPEVAAVAPDESYGELHVWRQGEVLRLRHGDALAATVTPTGAQIWMEDAAGLARALHQAFVFVVSHLLGWQNLFVVHGGAVAPAGGGALLILGPTGTGKSTLVLAGLRSGRLPLSDDLVVLRPGSGGLEVSGLGLPLAAPDDVGQAFLTGGDPIPADPRSRWSVSVGADVHGWHPLAASVVVGHGRSESGELVPLPARDVFDVVLRSYLAAPEPRLVRPFLSVAAAVSRIPAWTLHHGSTATSRVVVATQLLDSIAAQVPATAGPARCDQAPRR